MATNHTQNYNLNLWEPDDQVRRTEFNADNQKIDAALNQQAAALAAETASRESAVTDLEARSTTQIIKTVTVGTAAQSYTLPLSDIQWSAWREVIIMANVYAGGNVYQVYPNGISNNSVLGGSDSSITLVFFPMYTGNIPVQGIILSNNGNVFSCGALLNMLSGLRFVASSGTISASSKFTVYGVK